ncbi:MAG: MBL fold metallo-hydrolase [Tannerellaceae bacterium]|nr:MBL fold metallo-hydrolase [Tannerellaceae bacterium]
MKIEVIDTGYFYADGGAMFGAIPKSAWKKRYPCDEHNTCILAIRSLLITDKEKIILVDTGINHNYLNKLSWYRFFNLTNLEDKLLKRGIRAEDVTDVVLTHLHFDHCGNLSFPHARYRISRKQWENLANPHPLEASSVFTQDILPLEKKGSLCLVESTTSLTSQISLELFDGHSPGQIVPFISTPGQHFIYAGDVIPLSCHVSPEWISAYDLSAGQSYNEKIRLLEKAIQHNSAVIYAHDAYTTCSTIKKIHSFYKPNHNFINITKTRP